MFTLSLLWSLAKTKNLILVRILPFQWLSKGYYLSFLLSRTAVNILFSTSFKKNSFSGPCFDKCMWIKSHCLAFERMPLAEKMPQTFLVVTKSCSSSKRKKNYRQKLHFTPCSFSAVSTWSLALKQALPDDSFNNIQQMFFWAPVMC